MIKDYDKQISEKNHIQYIQKQTNEIIKSLQVFALDYQTQMEAFSDKIAIFHMFALVFHGHMKEFSEALSLKFINERQYSKLKELYQLFDEMILKMGDSIWMKEALKNHVIWRQIRKKCQELLKLFNIQIDKTKLKDIAAGKQY